MKARIVTVSLLLLLAVGGILSLNSQLAATALPVAMEVQDSVGDRSAASGLAVDYRVALNNNLRWYTRYAPANGNNNAAFSMTYRRNGRPTRYVSYPSGFYENDWKLAGSFITSDNMQDPVLRDAQQEMERRGLTSGEIRIYPADYYDSYPIFLSKYGTDDAGVLLYDCGDTIFPFPKLQIPVSEEDFYELYFSFDTYDGQQYLSSSGWNNRYRKNRFSPYAIPCETGVLVTVGFAADTEPEPDWAPDGFGLWYIPVRNQEAAIDRGTVSGKLPVVDECRLVYPLDIQRQKVVLLRRSLDAERILLITAEENAYVLHVLDGKDYHLLQRLELDTIKELKYSDTSVLSDMDGDLRRDIPDMSYQIVDTDGGTQLQTEYSDYCDVTMQQNASFTAVILGDRLVLLTASDEGFQIAFSCDIMQYGEVQNETNREGVLCFYYSDDEAENGDYYRVMPTVQEAYTMAYNGSMLAVAGYGYNDADMLLSIYGADGLAYAELVTASVTRQSGSGGFVWQPLWQDTVPDDVEGHFFSPQPLLKWME